MSGRLTMVALAVLVLLSAAMLVAPRPTNSRAGLEVTRTGQTITVTEPAMR